MFFLKHVLPLVIISVLIGYVVARVGLPPLDNRGTTSASKSQITDVSAQPEPASTGQGDILSRVREAVSGSSHAATAEAETPAEPDAVETTEPEPPVETTTAKVTEPVPPSAEETVTIEDFDVTEAEPKSPVEATSETEEPAKAVSIAMAESPETAIDQMLATDVAEDVAAEIDEQSSARSAGTLTAMSLEDLIGSRWSLGSEPTAPHLPSFITSCRQKSESLECWSGEYSAHAGSSAKTRTKSIIRNRDASGFTIRYRNMITDPVTKSSNWDKEVNQLDCAAQSQTRVRCVNADTGQELIYTRVTGEQFPSLFTLSSLAATQWYSGDQPAEYLPSTTTRCDSEASGLVCWSNARTVQSAGGSSSVKTRSLIRKTGNGTFSVTYRNLVTTDGQDIWEQDSREARCRVMGFERIVCEDEKGTRSYAKTVFTL